MLEQRMKISEIDGISVVKFYENFGKYKKYQMENWKKNNGGWKLIKTHKNVGKNFQEKIK